MAPSTSPPDADGGQADGELHTLAKVIRDEFSVDGEPLSEKEAERAAAMVMSRLHGAGFDVVELYDGDAWTTITAQTEAD